MTETNDVEIEDEEPNPERLEAIRNACQVFADVSRFNPESAPRNEDDMSEIIEGLLKRNRDLADSLEYTIEWRAIREKRQEFARRESEREKQEQARQEEIDDFKRPASEDRSALLAEMKSRQPRSRPLVPVDLTHLSQAEFDSIPDAELRRMLGAVRVEDRQGPGSGRTVKDERNALIREGKVLNRAGVRQVRSIKFSQEELRAQEERARVVAQDKAERRRLEEQWRKK